MYIYHTHDDGIIALILDLINISVHVYTIALCFVFLSPSQLLIKFKLTSFSSLFETFTKEYIYIYRLINNHL